MTPIERAIRDLLASMTSPPFPRTTLHADVLAGATSIQLDAIADSQGRSRIVEGSYLTFYDGTGEAAWKAGKPTTAGGVTTVPLVTCAALGITGLAHPHTATTPIYANVLTHPGDNQSGTLILGDPVIQILTTRQTDTSTIMPSAGFPLVSVEVSLIRRLEVPKGADIDPEYWNRYVYELSQSDLNVVANRLQSNQELITDFWPSAAEKFGDEGGVQIGDRRFNATPEDAIWHFVATLDLTILGTAQTHY